MNVPCSFAIGYSIFNIIDKKTNYFNIIYKNTVFILNCIICTPNKRKKLYYKKI